MLRIAYLLEPTQLVRTRQFYLRTERERERERELGKHFLIFALF